MFAVIVEFEVDLDYLSEFVDLLRVQAKNSLEREIGCHRFDVWTDSERRQFIYLYEIYQDENAFQEHLASEHFKVFDEKVRPFVTNKNVSTWNQPLSVLNVETES
ncbi:MAG: putative quinol monooxygenase [Pseudomonadota bacterium]